MKKVLFNVFIFAAGAGIGSAVTWKLVKSKYEQIAQEEIDSVKETFKKRLESIESPDVNTEKDQDESELQEVVTELGYSVETENKGGQEMAKPYVISPEDFDELDYDVVSLTYYADGYLADDMDELITDVDGLIGLESLNTFGQYEDDSVFVRNDELQTDYEILLDMRNYKDVVDPPYEED